ncbi:unnamed protein product [Brassica oleracea var. botrytis]|uniref:Uncharacterized protein n=1 Tax=Brassica napus TaxID=3708 RepID=A0ABQ8ABA9_BRANA|nr:hypothetical protein HID58_052223 [Brassica napus]
MRREQKVDDDGDGEFQNAVGFVGMLLSHKIHGAFKGAVERMTGPRTVSAFKEKGVLSVSEFVLAGDNLVSKCPTWSCLQYFLIPFCTPATEREKTVREMAAKREFLDLTGIPFPRGLLLPPLSSHCNLFFLIIHALLSSSSIKMFSLVISVAGNSSVEYSCGSRTR